MQCLVACQVEMDPVLPALVEKWCLLKSPMGACLALNLQMDHDIIMVCIFEGTWLLTSLSQIKTQIPEIRQLDFSKTEKELLLKER